MNVPRRPELHAPGLPAFFRDDAVHVDAWFRWLRVSPFIPEQDGLVAGAAVVEDGVASENEVAIVLCFVFPSFFEADTVFLLAEVFTKGV